jgi:hypothetical protein
VVGKDLSPALAWQHVKRETKPNTTGQYMESKKEADRNGITFLEKSTYTFSGTSNFSVQCPWKPIPRFCG